MATATVPNTMADGATITAAEHNENYAALATFLNEDVIHVDGSRSMTNPLTVATPTDSLHAATKAYVDSGSGYVVRNYSNVKVSMFIAQTATVTFTGSSPTASHVYNFPVTVGTFRGVFVTPENSSVWLVWRVTAASTTSVTIEFRTIDGSNPPAGAYTFHRLVWYTPA